MRARSGRADLGGEGRWRRNGPRCLDSAPCPLLREHKAVTRAGWSQRTGVPSGDQVWTCFSSHRQCWWINPVELQPTALFPSFFHVKNKNPRRGVLMAEVTPRLRSDGGGTTYLHPSLFDRHYCLTECFPKSHRSDRITLQFAPPSACLSNTNARFLGCFFFLSYRCTSPHFHLPLWHRRSYRASTLHPTRWFDSIVLFVGSEQLVKRGNENMFHLENAALI